MLTVMKIGGFVLLFLLLFLLLLFSECDSPPAKKLKTSSVVVEQGQDSDKILIDQVTDVDSIFDEVLPY